MNGNGTDPSHDRLVLRSRLPGIAQVPPWIQNLAKRYAIPEDLQFAMDLCLEEVLSNIIRHGYAATEDRPISVSFNSPRRGFFEIVVEDEAPQFNPLDAPELPLVTPSGQMRIGSQGIRLLRRFADALKYESTPTGNRLRMEFSAAGSEVQTK